MVWETTPAHVMTLANQVLDLMRALQAWHWVSPPSMDLGSSSGWNLAFNVDVRCSAKDRAQGRAFLVLTLAPEPAPD